MTTQLSDTVTERVINLIEEKHDIAKEEITLDSRFEADLGFDSLAMTEFVMDIEDEFNVEVPTKNEESISSVWDAVCVIQKLISQNQQ